MRRIVAIEREGAADASDAVRADFDRRSRRRIVLETIAGEKVLLDVARAVHLRDGDRLRLDDGRVVAVQAVDEALVEIVAPDSAALVRVAWHLGNRHLPTQLVAGPHGGALRIRADHVIAAMAEGLGARCTALDAPFDPEGGAYAGEEERHGHPHGDRGEHGATHAHGAADHDHGHHAG